MFQRDARGCEDGPRSEHPGQPQDEPPITAKVYAEAHETPELLEAGDATTAAHKLASGHARASRIASRRDSSHRTTHAVTAMLSAS